MAKILLLNGDIAIGNSVNSTLETEGYVIDYITKLSDLVTKLQSTMYDLLIADCTFPTGTDENFVLPENCFDAYEVPSNCENFIVPAVKQYQPELPIIFHTLKRKDISLENILATNPNYTYLRMLAGSPSMIKQQILDILAAR